MHVTFEMENEYDLEKTQESLKYANSVIYLNSVHFGGIDSGKKPWQMTYKPREGVKNVSK